MIDIREIIAILDFRLKGTQGYSQIHKLNYELITNNNYVKKSGMKIQMTC